MLIDRKGFSLVVGDGSACFLHHQHTGGTIPGFEFGFEEAIKSAGSDPTQIDGGGSEATNRHSFFYESGKYIEWSVGLIDVGIREAGNQACLDGTGFGADANGFIVEKGAFSFFGEEKFVDVRIIHHPHDHFSVFFNGDGDRVEWNAVCEVHGTIDRIDDPFVFVCLFVCARLFCQNLVIGIGRSNDGKDGFL